MYVECYCQFVNHSTGSFHYSLIIQTKGYIVKVKHVLLYLFSAVNGLNHKTELCPIPLSLANVFYMYVYLCPSLSGVERSSGVVYTGSGKQYNSMMRLDSYPFTPL